ncbi:hypothetical protein CHS0354_027615 [Potamilus streckersoni]|uniref:Uncharacterized protein n=1 Tax=Potamilus streckersoni TaxID=2493646 RepID=A0AAE0VNX7_9BIVA|nr:hypothetical protein CHS0354_027615 [Potamilus streckersoni]
MTIRNAYHLCMTELTTQSQAEEFHRDLQYLGSLHHQQYNHNVDSTPARTKHKTKKDGKRCTDDYKDIKLVEMRTAKSNIRTEQSIWYNADT